jgi:hypothetical protein
MGRKVDQRRTGEIGTRKLVGVILSAGLSVEDELCGELKNLDDEGLYLGVGVKGRRLHSTWSGCGRLGVIYLGQL